MSCFSYYRAMHRMRNPLCICARDLETCTTIPEAAVYVAQSGRYQGYWVAGCARGRCGYLGELIQSHCDFINDLTILLVCLDFYFNQSWGVLACQYYELRGKA